MPHVDIDGTPIAYQRFGQGAPLVLTAGGWYCRPNYMHYAAGRLAADHAVLLWDKRNGQGASGVALSDAPSEWYGWTDDLHHLLRTLDLAPAYFCGGSAGHVLSLLMAKRYPEDVKGLILYVPPTDDAALLRTRLAEPHYCVFADLAETEGMQAVIDASVAAWSAEISGKANPQDPHRLKKWIAETIQLHPQNREKMLSFEPGKFAETMRRWGNWVASERTYAANLTDEDLQKITVPTVLIPGWDELHPRRTAERLRGLLPNVEWVDLFERYPAARVEETFGDSTGTEILDLLCPIFAEAVAQIERGTNG